MNAEQIRELNLECQQKGLETKSVVAHEAGMKTLGLSLLAELTAQVAEANEHLVKLANPLLGVDVGAPGKIMAMPEQATLRDQFAMAAMQGMLASGNDHWDGEGDSYRHARLAYDYADAMLDRR